MPTIRVDQRVLDTLAVNGKFGDSYNDLLCDLLDLPRGRSSVPRPGRLAELVAAGLLNDGQVVVWHRRRIGERFTAAITGDGHMLTSDGRHHATPDVCASALVGYPIKGWTVWKTADGTTLKSLLQLLPPRTPVPGPAAHGEEAR